MSAAIGTLDVVRRDRTCRRFGGPGLLVLGALVTACKPNGDPRRVVVHDDGALCLGVSAGTDGGDGGGGDGGGFSALGVDLAAGQPLAIAVRSGCLSNVCATARSSTCAVKREGDRLLVTSDLVWIGPEDLGKPCPPECTFLEAQCATAPLPAGRYEVVLGAHTADVAVPSHLDRRCGDDKSPPAVPDAAVALAPTAAYVDPTAVPAAPGTGFVVEPPPGDTICLGPARATSESRALKAGQPIVVTVLRKNPCVDALCTRAPAKCTTKRKGLIVVVNTQFPTSTAKPTQLCIEDCNALAATCRTEALPAGSYTLELGTQRRTFQIPAAVAPPCGP